MKKLFLFIFLLVTISLFGQTEKYLMMVRGDTKTFGFTANIDVSDREVSFVVKTDTRISSPRLIWKRNDLAGGDSTEIYVSGSNITVRLIPDDTQDLTAMDYVYDIIITDTATHLVTSTIFTGTLAVWVDVQTPYDGIILPGSHIRVATVALPPGEEGDVLTWVDAEGQYLPVPPTFTDSLVLIIENIDSNFVFSNAYLPSDGSTCDSTDIADMFEAAVNKTLIMTDSIYVWDNIVDVDCEGRNLRVVSLRNTIISSVVEDPGKTIFAFWVGRDVGRPSVGAIYSTMDSQFEVVDTMVTENVLARRISGSAEIPATGTIYKVSGVGGAASYSYVTLITQDGRYYLPQGCINFKNAAKLEIEGIQFQFNNDNGYNRTDGPFLEGIFIDSCSQVIMKQNTVTDAYNWGVLVRVSDNIEITHNVIDSCLLGGLGIRAVKGGLVGWNKVNDNGIHAPSSGYGISFNHQSGTWQSNEDITAIGNQCNYNLRKAIDVHGGNNLVITGNSIKGFGDKAIGGYSTGDFEYGHLNEVNNLTITNNTIENDSVWYSNIVWGYGMPGYDEPYVVAIPIGTYNWGIPASGIHHGSVIVSGNKMKNLTVFQGDTLVSLFAIRVFTGAAHTVQISNNTVDSSTVVHGISVAAGNYEPYVSQIQNLDITGNSFTLVNAQGRDTDVGRIILATGGENVNISNNKMIECSAYGGFGINVIEVAPNVINNVKINNNHIDGDIRQIASATGIGIGIYVQSGVFQINDNSFSGHILTGECVYPTVTLTGTAKGNTYFGGFFIGGRTLRTQPLPDYFSATTGEFSTTFAKDTTTAADTIATMIVDAGKSYPYATHGSASFLVTVIVSSNSTPEQAIYEYYAWAKNDTTGQDTSLAYIDSVAFYIDTLSATVLEGVEDYPTLAWRHVYQTGGFTERLKQLDVYCTKPETIYKVSIKFQGYRLRPYYMTYF